MKSADHVIFTFEEKGKQQLPVLPPNPTLRSPSTTSKKLVLENSNVVMFHLLSIDKV